MALCHLQSILGTLALSSTTTFHVIHQSCIYDPEGFHKGLRLPRYYASTTTMYPASIPRHSPDLRCFIPSIPGYSSPPTALRLRLIPLQFFFPHWELSPPLAASISSGSGGVYQHDTPTPITIYTALQTFSPACESGGVCPTPMPSMTSTEPDIHWTQGPPFPIPPKISVPKRIQDIPLPTA
eukprot:jgi/Psemu1/48284/gm1.48284_g